MPYLSYVSDERLEDIVRDVLERAIRKNDDLKKNPDKYLSANVIDPFSALMDASIFEMSHNDWILSEVRRQVQKTLVNFVGEMHQKLLGSVDGWEDLGVGGAVDLVCYDRKIIAEVKNKHNTVTGGKLSDQYKTLDDLISPKNSTYKGYIAYFVNIIPSKPEKINMPFEPSDKSKGRKCPRNEAIRIIDGVSFYELVTGEDSALYDFYSVLPTVIENIFKNTFEKSNFIVNDVEAFRQYFLKAYKK